MSTSLSEQLKRLSLPQTTLLQTEEKKEKDSLLFDPREAASLKRETIYQIGLDGLEELIKKNQTFEQFKNNLYHITSKKFERSVQTEESNIKLNNIIRKFLLQLSPYVPLNCAHKALEWLIRRYKIHEYNRDDLIMVILPYHESNIFVRLVQLMKFKDHNDQWFFLKTLQTTGVHLTKQNLLNHAAGDVFFVKFVGKFIKLLVKQFEKPTTLTVAFNFYCSVYAGAIEYSKVITEGQISQMLPTLLKGLSSDIPDFCAASLVILGCFLTKARVSDELLNIIVTKISSCEIELLKNEIIYVLLILYQTQTHFQTIPKEAVSNLLRRTWLLGILQKISNARIYDFPFLKVFIKGVIQLDKEENCDFIKKMLAVLKLEETLIEDFFTIIIDTLTLNIHRTDSFKKSLRDIIEIIERQYPDQFDKQMYQIVSASGKNKRKKCLETILKETLNQFDIFTKLYHPSPAIRKETIHYLTNNYDTLREREKEMIKTAMIQRLNDENIDVVSETLDLLHMVAVLRAPVKQVLIQLAYKCQQDLSKWRTVPAHVVLMLCESDSDDWHLLPAVFPYLLPFSQEELELAYLITESYFFKTNPFFNISRKTRVPSKFRNMILYKMKSSKVALYGFLDYCKEVKLEGFCTLGKFSMMVILVCILPEGASYEMSAQFVHCIIRLFDSCQASPALNQVSLQDQLNFTKIERIYIESVLNCLNKIIEKTQKTYQDLSKCDFTKQTPFNDFLQPLFKIFLSSKPGYRKYNKKFIHGFCPSLVSKFEFLLNLAATETDSQAEHLIRLLLKFSLREAQLNSLFESDLVIPYFLALLMHKSIEIKTNILRIFEILVGLGVENCYQGFLEELLIQRDVITADNDQVALILFNYLSSNDQPLLKQHLIKLCGDFTIPVCLKVKLLDIISHVNDFGIFSQLSEDCLWLLLHDSFTEMQSSIIAKHLLRFQEGIAKDIVLESNIWKLIETCLRKDSISLTCNGKQTCTVVLLLEQFTPDFYTKLSYQIKTKFLDLLIETATLTKNPEVLPSVRHFIRHIDLDAELILSHFLAMRDVHSPKIKESTLKRRISVVPTIDILDTLEWRKGVTTLEFIQNKKKFTNFTKLLPTLFAILKKCLDFDEQAAVEYPKQLILFSILDLSKKSERCDLSETTFNMELIVQCIRASQNPQTHYCALLVLAFSAELFPAQVLHNIMAIFTFMGSSLLRHEDAYSLQIISKIIDTIIPILVADGNQDNIVKVLRVFVDIMLDVPEHRRMTIYRQLLTKITIDNSLYIFLLLAFDSHVNHADKAKTETRLEIAANICREFSPKIVIQNCINLVQFLNELPDEIDTEATIRFGIRFQSQKQFRHFKYTLIVFISKLLASKEFVLLVTALKSEELLQMEQLYKDMIIKILTYIHRISKITERTINTPQAKYWKVILHLCYDILDSVNAILTPQMFVLVVKGLMLHNFNSIRKRSMELLNAKFQNTPDFFSTCSREEIYSLVPPLLSIIKKIDRSVEGEEELIIQTALLSLKLLIKILINDYTEKFTEILDFITELVKSEKAKNNILASVLLCLAELIENLRANAIKSLPLVMPVLLKILKQQSHHESSSLLLLSSITTVQKIIETLPLFLSPYLEKLLYQLFVLASKMTLDEEKFHLILNKIVLVQQQVGNLIPSRVLIPILGQVYEKLVSRNTFDAIKFLMEVLGANIDHLNRNEINANLPELTSFFLGALQFRTSTTDIDFQEINKIESKIVEALTKLILKLSETTFKNLYYKLYDWATRHEEKTERLITFYALSAAIAKSLKSIFVSFGINFLKNSAKALDACNIAKTEDLYFNDEKKDLLLLENVLDTLHTLFLHDTNKFVNKERFEVLLDPLLDQLENQLGGIERLEERNDKLLTPSVVQFAIAAGDDSLWKQLNCKILDKMRHNSASIRLVALFCLKEVVSKLGVDYLPLLPETIPVLAELLEDEEESVEKACKKAVQEMEKILGEPIEKYFKM